MDEDEIEDALFKNSYIDASDLSISSNMASNSSDSDSTLSILAIAFSLIVYWLLIIFAILVFIFSLSWVTTLPS